MSGLATESTLQILMCGAPFASDQLSPASVRRDKRIQGASMVFAKASFTEGVTLRGLALPECPWNLVKAACCIMLRALGRWRGSDVSMTPMMVANGLGHKDIVEASIICSIACLWSWPCHVQLVVAMSRPSCIGHQMAACASIAVLR